MDYSRIEEYPTIIFIVKIRNFRIIHMLIMFLLFYFNKI